MLRLFFAGYGFVGFVVLVVWVYCILDVIAADGALIRNLPKVTWLIIVLLFGPVGCIAWLALGRPAFAGWRPGDTTVRQSRRRYVGPDDDPDFGRGPRHPRA